MYNIDDDIGTLSEGNDSEKCLYKNVKTKNSDSGHLKEYQKEDTFIESTKPKTILSEESSLKVNNQYTIEHLVKLDKESNLECVALSSSTIKDKQLRDCAMLIYPHVKCLTKYLKEDNLIGPTKARKLMREEIGLDLSVQTVNKYLKMLREKLGPEYSNLDPSVIKNRQLDDLAKFKNLHLECLKEYLKEDSFIGPTEANRKLKKDTSLEVSVSTVRKAMSNLRKEMGLEYSKLDQSTINSRRLADRSKLKDFHLECLKKILKESDSIGSAKARDILYQETDLYVSIPTIYRHLKALKKEMGIENPNIDQSTVKSRRPGCRTKFKDLHLECLRNYLVKDRFIGPAEAKNRIQEDTGLEIGLSTIQKAMTKLRKEMNIERASLDQSAVKNRELKDRAKLKDSHLECLKKYLNEDILIGPTESRNRLQEETNLKISVYAVKRAMLKLRKEINVEYANLDTSSVKDRQSKHRSKLKDAHLALLRKYLARDNFIGPTKAWNLLHEETSLEVHVSTIQRAMKKLRIDMGLEISSLDSSMRNAKSTKQAKLKVSQLKRLKKYLKDDEFIGPMEARNRFEEETGIRLTISNMREYLINIKEKSYNIN
ncbi:hypothetical protein CONCODRAFT_78579 [Conidiobolus coronatus NRRL 28638]|uniref:Uncharacterized protein n=1 Tax=Conidiobolus coronatus (strain ATCC 28846 / CBS 209.66 / NRRL 28638) TaxID=796925 RepID=A0A137P7K3_CONC2|nr:hypothetical protein CONCODRAFT_78579 [Conidiobolus coronatus NRRL 28638]|eukprot:KXN70997.1 hypothetical protein CONCODRAFT_78579 [Conidiobolus coronatus NRRL 28638]